MMMLFFNFISRGIFSPLLPVLENQFGVDHGRGSTLFLIIALSQSTSMVLSGFISARLQHRGTIILYTFLLGFSLFLCAMSPSFTFLQISVGILGVSTGIYAPSGAASVTNLASEEHWGKALGIHELGPNLGLIAAPLIIGFAVPQVRWETILIMIGAALWIYGGFYSLKGRGSTFAGAPPNVANLKLIFHNRSFWILALYLVLAASSAIGIYSILPTYLILEKGFNPQIVNFIIGTSRITGLLFILGAGFLVDRFGIRLFIGITLGLSALFAALLGLLEGTPLLISVFLQPIIISAFFPVANSAVSAITRPETRNVAFSMIIPLASAIGAGVTPTGMGILGEAGHFSTGFVLLAVLTIAGLFLLPFLRVEKKKDILR